MSDRNDSLTQLRGALPRMHAPERPGKEQLRDGQADEQAVESCAAFGYLRGSRERALAIEFRFRDGNSDTFAYSVLNSWRFDPSAGLLLKFTGDVVTLVLIRGSNMDALVNESVNLTDRGLQRHRITYVREMDEEELRTVGEGGPTIDRIEVAEFDSQEALHEWLKKTAPAFLRKPGPAARP